eukprot:scaffold22279_cov123-Isochrysis_galbana.AAC.4
MLHLTTWRPAFSSSTALSSSRPRTAYSAASTRGLMVSPVSSSEACCLPPPSHAASALFASTATTASRGSIGPGFSGDDEAREMPELEALEKMVLFLAPPLPAASREGRGQKGKRSAASGPTEAAIAAGRRGLSPDGQLRGTATAGRPIRRLQPAPSPVR